MHSTVIFIGFFTVLSVTSCSGVPLSLPDKSTSFVVENKNLIESKKGELVKRQIEPNRDSQLKQISLHGLIGDLESSLFQSALSLNNAHQAGFEVQDIRPSSAAHYNQAEHFINKRENTSSEKTNDNIHFENVKDSKETFGEEHNIIVQTTKKIPEVGGVPAHIVIDHISIQPHTGGVPLIPTFQVHHTKVVSVNKEINNTPTTISLTKTSITSATQNTTETKIQNNDNSPVIESTLKPTSSIITLESKHNTSEAEHSFRSPVDETKDISTKSKLEKSNKAEEQLKEKIAEIEADPIILSARV